MGKIDLDFFKSPFSTDTGTLENNIPTLDEVDEGHKFSTLRALHFSSSVSPSKEFSTITDTTLNSDSLLAYTLVTSTIGYQHTSEKEEAR